MNIVPGQEYRFGQSSITRSGDTVIKSFYNQKDYFREKYFLDLLLREGLDFITPIISTDDLNHEIITPYYGEMLDDTNWRTEKLKWFSRIADLMEKVWTIKTPVKNEYVKIGQSAYQFIEKFLSDGSNMYLSKAGIEQSTIDKTTAWLKNILNAGQNQISLPHLIHFDLSPRNILINKNSLYVIDWSRAMYSELPIEISIMREKLETIGQPLDSNFLSDMDIDFIDNMAKCFSIYRKAKKIGTTISKPDYLKFLETTISSK